MMTKLLLGLDLFPLEISFYFNGDKSFKSLPGAIATIAAVILSFVGSILLIYLFFSNKTPALIQTKLYLDTPTPLSVKATDLLAEILLFDILNFSQKQVVLLENTITQFDVDYTKIFTQTPIVYSAGQMTTLNKVTEQSLLKQVADTKFAQLNKSHIIITNYSGKYLKIGGSFLEGNYSYVENTVKFDICGFSQNCQNYSENVSIITLFSESYFDLYSYQGFKSGVLPFRSLVIPNFHTVINLYYQLNEVTTNDNLFYENERKSSFYSIDLLTYTLQSEKQISNTETMITVNFMSNPFIIGYTRSYPKLITLLANINALVGGIFLLCRGTLRILDSGRFDLTMINNLFSIHKPREDKEETPLKMISIQKDIVSKKKKGSERKLVVEENKVVKKQQFSKNEEKAKTENLEAMNYEEVGLGRCDFLLFSLFGPSSKCCIEGGRFKVLQYVNQYLKDEMDIINIIKRIHGLYNHLGTLSDSKKFETDALEKLKLFCPQ